MNVFSRRTKAAALVATTAVIAALAGTGGSAQAADDHGSQGSQGIKVSKHDLMSRAGRVPSLGTKAAPGEPGSSLPAGVPTSGRYAFLLKLSTKGTARAYSGAVGKG